MLVVGELINASRKAIAAAIEAKDTDLITKTAADQSRAGAGYIDVNAGIFVHKEADCLRWLITTVQQAVDAPCCIDSPNPKAIETALSADKRVSTRWLTVVASASLPEPLIFRIARQPRQSIIARVPSCSKRAR